MPAADVSAQNASPLRATQFRPNSIAARIVASCSGCIGRVGFVKLDIMKQRFASFFLALACALTPYHALAAQLTVQEAIAKVERETGGKVLSAETKHAGKQAIYRIKVLTRDGQVKVVEVPADG